MVYKGKTAYMPVGDLAVPFDALSQRASVAMVSRLAVLMVVAMKIIAVMATVMAVMVEAQYACGQSSSVLRCNVTRRCNWNSGHELYIAYYHKGKNGINACGNLL